MQTRFYRIKNKFFFLEKKIQRNNKKAFKYDTRNDEKIEIMTRIFKLDTRFFRVYLNKNDFVEIVDQSVKITNFYYLNLNIKNVKEFF